MIKFVDKPKLEGGVIKDFTDCRVPSVVKLWGKYKIFNLT